jgi:hypothetical protein
MPSGLGPRRQVGVEVLGGVQLLGAAAVGCLVGLAEETLAASDLGALLGVVCDPLAVAQKVRAILALLRGSDLDLDKGRRKPLKKFRRSRELPVGAVPIAMPRSQIEDFNEFLAMYGI